MVKKILEKVKVWFGLKKVWIPTAVLASLLLIFLIWGGVYYSKSSVINRYVAAYSQSDATFEDVKEYLIWSDTGKRITNEEARYANFSQLDEAEAQQLTQSLGSAKESDQAYIKRVGSKFGIFPNYKIAMKPLALTIKTNVNNVDVLLNSKKVVTTDSEDFSVTIERLLMSDYTASLSGLYNNKKIELSRVYDGQNNLLDLTVIFKTFTVTSNLTSGELFFDETRIGSLTEGRYEVSDYPMTGAAQAYVKKTYSDGEVTSNKKTLADITEGEEVALNADNLLDETKAGEVLLSSFEKLIDYLNNGQDPSDLATVFEAGADNDFYKGLKESIKGPFVTDNRKATSMTIPSILVTGLTQVGKERYLIDFSTTYDFYYDKETDAEKHTHGNITQDLTGKVTLKKSGDSYLVSKSGQKSITVVDVDNQVKADGIFPEELIGSWTGKMGDNTITMTFAEDGTITKKVDSKNGATKSSSHSAKVTELEEKSDGLYRYIYDDGADTAAFVTSAIGGTGVKYAYGVKIDSSKISPVVWQAPTDGNFDFNDALTGESLTKKE